ncbi:lipopolysaccharide biosynthesis protein [Nitrincola sp.]|uniref:lipopolysaccharide biosynthesis protein n=1 Tax=Nitrincola sp. TaxID=1926584 RepID=UPI003A8D84CF
MPLIGLLIPVDSYGDIVLTFTYVVILMSVGQLGQNRTILRFEGIKFATFETSSAIALLSSIIIAGIAVKILEIHSLVIFAVVFIVYLNLLYSKCRVDNNIVAFSILKLSYPILKLLSFFALMFFADLNLSIGYVIAEIFSSFISVLVGIRFIKFKKAFNKIEVPLFMKFGIPVFFQTILLHVIQYGDKIFVSSYFGKIVLANYFFVSIFCTCVVFLFSYFSQKYEVIIYRAKNWNEAKRRTTNYLIKCLMSGFAFFPIALLSYLIAVQVNGDYDINYRLMLLMYASSLLGAFTNSYFYLIGYLNKNSLIIKYSLFLCLLYVTFIFTGVEQLGIYVMPAANIFATLVSLIVFSRLITTLRQK